MTETRRKHILLIVIGVLGALLVLDRAVWPMVARALTSTDRQISALKASLARVPKEGDLQTDLLIRRIQAAQTHFALPMTKRQQYLESRIGQNFMGSAVPGQPTDVQGWPGKQVVSFQLKLRPLTLAELTEVLASLDEDPLPMRVDRVRIVPVDEVERMLQVELTVSTLTEVGGGATPPAATTMPAEPPATQPVRIVSIAGRPALKNIFFPELMITRRSPERPDLVSRPFKVVGIEGAGPTGRVLLRMRDPDETIWLDVGMTLDGIKLIDVQPTAAVFKLGGDTARLAVGESSGRLLMGKRTFRAHCTIAATITTPAGPLALGRFPGHNDYVYLAVGDVLPSGRIVTIGPDSVTVEYAGWEEVIRVGQDSDSPIPPWTMME